MTKPPRPRAEVAATVERVAKAICAHDPLIPHWKFLHDYDRKRVRSIARAAIRAMSPPRKPRAEKGKRK